MKKGVVNGRVGAILPSESLNIASKAKALAAAGEKVCNLSAGEPDFDTPDHIKQAAIDSLRRGETKYTPVAGLLSLRKAIAEKLRTENGLDVTPARVIVSNGAKQSLFNVFMALLRDDDEVILLSPFWLSYPEMIGVAGGKTVVVRGRQERGFKVTPEEVRAAVTSRTKALVINSPSNPSGIVYSESELRELADIAVACGFYIISDEIYEKIVYDEARHVSVGSLSPEIGEWTITVNGFSKAYAMTGWRLGYVAAPDFLTQAMDAFQSHSTSGPNTFAQFGALAALQAPSDDIERMRRAFSERRDYLVRRLEAIKGVSCVKPAGAFYMLPNIARFGLSGVVFAERLLEREKVATIPGGAFGSPDHIRLSYACGLNELAEGMDRFERFVAAL